MEAGISGEQKKQNEECEQKPAPVVAQLPARSRSTTQIAVMRGIYEAWRIPFARHVSYTIAKRARLCAHQKTAQYGKNHLRMGLLRFGERWS